MPGQTGPIRCIAYREDGRLCGRPATQLDRQRGGMVCGEHAPARALSRQDETEAREAEWDETTYSSL